MRVAAAAFLSALATIAIQAIAIVTLAPAAYGAFAAAYLVFGLFCSIALSLVCEPWSRARATRGGDWSSFGALAVTLSALSLVPAVVVATFVGDVIAAGAIAAAVALSTYRFCGRFHFAAIGADRWVLPADAVNLVATVTAWLVLQTAVSPLQAVTLAWAIGSLASALLMPLPGAPSIGTVRTWLRGRRDEIRPLLVDSTLLDLGTVALPLCLAPALGASDFGLYRALSSLAVPVRLVLLPLRPMFGARPLHRHASGRNLLAVTVAALALGGAAAGAFALIVGTGLFPGSTLSDAATHYGPLISLYIALTFVGTYFYFVSRVHADGRTLLLLRVVQLASAVVLQVAGFMIAGLDGALVGATAAAAVQTASVIVAARRVPAAAPTREAAREAVS